MMSDLVDQHVADDVAQGFVVFGEVPSMATLIGAAVIVAAGLYIFLREQQLGKIEPEVAPPV